jgi:hypothetical protein
MRIAKFATGGLAIRGWLVASPAHDRPHHSRLAARTGYCASWKLEAESWKLEAGS